MAEASEENFDPLAALTNEPRPHRLAAKAQGVGVLEAMSVVRSQRSEIEKAIEAELSDSLFHLGSSSVGSATCMRVTCPRLARCAMETPAWALA
jgi:hypothetical protein